MRPVRAEGYGSVLAGGSGKEAISFEAQAEAIDEQFRRQLSGLRRRFREWEILAVVRGLREERRMSLRLLRERHDTERRPARKAQPRGPPPTPKA